MLGGLLMRRGVLVGWTATLMLLIMGCAATRGPYTTQREKTAKGAGIGAAVGALAAVIDGKNEADEILVGAALGAALGAGVGAYMDAQEEKLARIPGTTVERVGRDTLLVHFESDILFAVDSTALNATSRATLNEVAQVLVEFPKTAIVVQGHTDATGTELYNQGLSERRAVSVKNFLIGRSIDPNRIAAIGYGESMPVASNATVSGRQLNRRVDLLLKGKAR